MFKRLKMIWWVLTKKNISVYWVKLHENIQHEDYETTAIDNLAAYMACNMCMWAKSIKYKKEQILSRSCNHFENYANN